MSDPIGMLVLAFLLAMLGAVDVALPVAAGPERVWLARSRTRRVFGAILLAVAAILLAGGWRDADPAGRTLIASVAPLIVLCAAIGIAAARRAPPVTE